MAPTSTPLVERVARQVLQHFPTLTLERIDSGLRVPANSPTGFEVELVDAGHEVVVSLGGWVAYGLPEEEALPLFLAGLLGNARVREIGRGGVTYRWKAEFLQDNKWVSEHDYFSFPLLASPRVLLGARSERRLWNDPVRLSRPQL
jgi:hypothetical protein